MYIPGKNRYDNYTSRYDVYLFTLRDYVEMLLDKYQGQYINRSDMPIHSGYLLEFVKIDEAIEFITAISKSHKEDTDLGVVTYVLPHLDGNDLPLYATTKEGVNTFYIGLSEYPEALEKYEEDPALEKYVISFDANGGEGTMNDVQVNAGETYTIPDSAFTAPEGKVFSKWGDAAESPSTTYDADEEITVEGNLELFAQWIDE